MADTVAIRFPVAISDTQPEPADMSPPRANDREPLKLPGLSIPAWVVSDCLQTLRAWGLWGLIVCSFVFCMIWSTVSHGTAVASAWADRAHAEAEVLRANLADQHTLIMELKAEMKRISDRLAGGAQ